MTTAQYLPYPTWMDDEAISLTNKYMNYDETCALDLYKRLARTASGYLGEVFYEPILECLYKGWLSPATPVATNYGALKEGSQKPRGLPVSCFGLKPHNSVDDIYKVAHEAAMLSKNGGGLGINLSDLIGDSPVTAWAKLYDLTAKIVSQGGIRRGAVALYLDVEHPDIEAFLHAKFMLEGDPREKLDCNIAIILPDSFMNKLISGDAYTSKVFAKILELRMKQGSPYLFFIDNANRQRGLDYTALDIFINTSQLCNEITLYCDYDHTYTCVLSSLVLSRWDEYRYKTWEIDGDEWTVTGLSIAFLDAVVESFIDLAVDIPGFEKAVNFTKKSRALGLGVLGWHRYLQQNNIPFSSPDAFRLNKEIFADIKQQAVKASKKLASMFGIPEWCEASRQRNTHLLAIAPTLATSVLSAGGSPGVEPIASNIYMYAGANGSYLRKNPCLINYLEMVGLNQDPIWDLIVADDGSVKLLAPFLEKAGVDEEEIAEFMHLFQTAYEIDQNAVIDQAADRQVDVCQGQSINLYIPHDEEAPKIASYHIRAWKRGMKGLYYIRSTSPRTKAINLEEDKVVNSWHIETIEGCSYCGKAKSLFKQHGIVYTEQEILEPVSGVTYPRVYRNGDYIGGYSELDLYLNPLDALQKTSTDNAQAESCSMLVVDETDACMSCSG